MSSIAELLPAAAAQPRATALAGIALAAVVCDWRMRRLPNVLTFGGALLGIAFAAAGFGAGPQWTASLGGGAIAFALMLPLYLLRTTGAGDVKLMAALGTFLSPADAAYAALFTFVAGGVLALAWAAWHRSLANLAHTLHAAVAAAVTGASPGSVPSVGRMPYALAIAAGTLCCVWARHPFGT